MYAIGKRRMFSVLVSTLLLKTREVIVHNREQEDEDCRFGRVSYSFMR
jgi:hypothetical protein